MSLSLERASWPATKCRPAFEWLVALQVKQTFFDTVGDDCIATSLPAATMKGRKDRETIARRTAKRGENFGEKL